MSNTLTYNLRPSAGIIQHGRSRFLRLVRDGDYEEFEEPDFSNRFTVEAQVRSGDYFITLASKLDWLGRSTDHTTRMRLEDIVSDLIYLHDNFSIDEKKAKRD
jgi:hypothetical protein